MLKKEHDDMKLLQATNSSQKINDKIMYNLDDMKYDLKLVTYISYLSNKKNKSKLKLFRELICWDSM